MRQAVQVALTVAASASVVTACESSVVPSASFAARAQAGSCAARLIRSIAVHRCPGDARDFIGDLQGGFGVQVVHRASILAGEKGC
jgi:hypothetical protein